MATTPALAAIVQSAWPSATPAAVATPSRRPPASVFRIVSAVSCPGVQITTAETATNAARLSSTSGVSPDCVGVWLQPDPVSRSGDDRDRSTNRDQAEA